MFESLKDFINSRIGNGIIIEEFQNHNDYFITIDKKHLYSVLFFLKNDPDLKLTLFEQLFALPSENSIALYYQLKSLKLPYRVTVVLTNTEPHQAIPSILALFLGARWQELDLAKTFDITFLESMPEQ